jgi:hypothetical protein
MAPPIGSHNNPNGRPAKSQALTDSLKVELNRTYDFDGKKISGKKIVAKLVSRAIITGRFRFPDDTEDSVISIKDWIEFVKWAYERVDGKPVQPISGEEGGAIVIEYVNNPYPVADVPPESSGDTPESK